MGWQWSRLSWAALVVWSVWALMTAGLGVMVWAYGSNFPLRDEWYNISQLVGVDSLRSAWIWEQWSGHCVVLTRLILWSLARLTGCDFRAPMWANLALLSTSAAVLIVAAKSLRGRTDWPDLLLPILFLSPGHAENLLLGWNVQNTLECFLVCVLLAVVADYRQTPARLATIGVCLALLPLTGAAGMPVVLMLLPWFAFPLLGMLRGRPNILAGLILGLGVASAYTLCVSLSMGAHPLYRATIFEIAQGATEVLSMGFGSGAVSLFLLAGAATIATLAAAFVILRLRSSGERYKAVGLAALLVGLVGVGVGIGWTRGGEGHACTNARYALLAAPAIGTGYCVFVLKRQRVLQIAVASFAALCFVPSASMGLEHARTQRANVLAVEAELRAGRDYAGVAEKYGSELWSPFDGPATAGNVFWIRTGMMHLKNRRLGPFKD